MWLQQALAVFFKEMVDSGRDRRAVASSLLYALFGPFLVVMMLGAIGKSQNKDQPLELTVAGRANAPHLVAYLEQQGVVVTEADSQAEAAVREGDLRLLLRIPAEFGSRWRGQYPAPVELLYDSSRLETSTATGRLRTLLERYGQLNARQRLLARGVAPSVGQPLDLRNQDFATPLAKAARILGTFPIFFLLAAFIGGLSVAIDSTAGERERSSLESLLTHATPTSALAVGKWAAATVFNLVSVVVTLGVTVALFARQAFEGLEIPLRFGLDQALPTLAVLLPLVILVPALQMALAVYSKSFKEAQSYAQVLMFVPMIPGLMLALNALKPEPWMNVVPVLAQEILLVDLLAGKTITSQQFFLATSTALLTTALLLVGLSRLLRQEKIILAR